MTPIAQPNGTYELELQCSAFPSLFKRDFYQYRFTSEALHWLRDHTEFSIKAQIAGFYCTLRFPDDVSAMAFKFRWH